MSLKQMEPPIIEEKSAAIVYYCKDCYKIVPGIRIGKKYGYKCGECGTKNVAFGTEKSIKSFYHVG